MSQDFLVELGTEELPPKSLLHLADAFKQSVELQLNEYELAFVDIKAFATPRRLAILVTDLATSTPQKEITVWGPPAKVAFDADGKATKAAQAFAAKNNLELSELVTDNDGKADKLVCRKQDGGVATVELLEGIIETALANLPIPKRMRWGANRYEFIRPVHWLVMLFGGNIVPAEIMGLHANRETRGHRFHYNQTLDLQEASDYGQKLKEIAHVVADFDERKNSIHQQVNILAEKQNAQAVIDDDLLNEVTALVEWPVALLGKFEERFLEVPAEALISSMKEHQKYFHLVDMTGNLLPYFITVSNIDSQDPAQVIDGNERVIRPRLADAAFFFETDKKTSLQQKREQLNNIVFQAKLGSIYNKTERVANLAVKIATALNSGVELAQRAGQLCKSDLVSEMVLEFSDMQGIAGFYYAQHDGEAEEVSQAMKEHYQPRFAGDELPATETGAVLALADRLDTLVGIFGIGEQPTGSKDPFALRRSSLGVLRLLIEQKRDLDLRTLIEWAYEQYSQLPLGDAVVEQALNYMLDRFRAWYDDQTIPINVFQSVNAKKLSHPLDINHRVQAVNYFRQLPEADALAVANKRVANILSKVDFQQTEVDQNLLQESAEKTLAAVVLKKQQEVSPLFAARDYQAALTALATLREPVDDFFDHVMVMVDDKALKTNRLALLQQLRNLFFEVADISCLVVS